MPTTLTRSVAELRDLPEFKTALTEWEKHRRCPWWLEDLLEERGYREQARAAGWAATEPERPHPDEDSDYPPFPHKWYKWGWYLFSKGNCPYECDDLPSDDLDCHMGEEFSTIPEALVWMLDYLGTYLESIRNRD